MAELVTIYRLNKVAALIACNHVPVAIARAGRDAAVAFPSTVPLQEDIAAYDSKQLTSNTAKFVQARAMLVDMLHGDRPFDVTLLQQLASAA